MSLQVPTREEIETLAKLQAKATKDRVTLHKFGITLRYLGVGLMLGALIERFHFHQTPTWPAWLWFAMGVLVLVVTGIIIPHNKRFMILHATAADAFYGVLNTENGSSQRILYVDQGEAALTELEARYRKMAAMRKRFSFKRHERNGNAK